MTDLLWNIALVIIFVLIGGVFAATEMALVTLRESQLTAIAARGRRGERVAELARNPNTFLSAVQIGVTVAGFASSAYGATSISPSVVPLLVSWGIGEQLAGTLSTVVLTLIIAFLSLVLGELVPKRLAIQRNASFSYAVAPVLGGFATVMRPVIWLLSVCTNALVRVLGGDPHKTADEMSEEEIRDIVSTHQGLPEDERRILDDVLSMRGRQISEVMRPRPEITGLAVGSSIAEAVEKVRDLPFSRYPVFEASIDDIVGFVHVRDLFDADDADRPLSAVMRALPYLPSTARVLPTLTRLRAENDQIAVVVDEYGGTDGIVTLEDLVEEVVGEIFDEYDTDSLPSAEGGLIDGRGASDTIAGFVIERLGRLAVVGDTVQVPGATIRVMTVERRRIAWLRITASNESEAPAARTTHE
jgi:putative hemolysin